MRYLARSDGYLAMSVTQVVAFAKSRPEEEYGDLQISFRPMTFTFHFSGRAEVDPLGAVSASVYCVRPKPMGQVSLLSSDPKAAPSITPNYLAPGNSLQTDEQLMDFMQ